MILSLTHILTSMKDASSRLEDAIREKDIEQEKKAKKEILGLQIQMRGML